MKEVLEEIAVVFEGSSGGREVIFNHLDSNTKSSGSEQSAWNVGPRWEEGRDMFGF